MIDTKQTNPVTLPVVSEIKKNILDEINRGLAIAEDQSTLRHNNINDSK